MKLFIGCLCFLSVSTLILNPSALSEEKEVILRVKKGMSLTETAWLLKKNGLIKNIFYFKAMAYLRGKSAKIKAGEYSFKKSASSYEILNTLVTGQVRLYKITFPEGYNIYEMAEALEKEQFLKKKAFLSLCHKKDFIYKLLKLKVSSLEGYLFPDTYYIPKPVDPKKLIHKMIKNFFKTFKQISQGRVNQKGRRGLKLTQYELVILASIVEKETGQAYERARIASVFYNRLKKGMRLESDPTILYGMMQEAGKLIPLNIRKKDILRKTPYNTYKVSGFPLSPISNPGQGALKAVFEPEESPFLYFVSRNDGSHLFSKTYKEHKKAVDRYQRSLMKSR